MPASNGTAIIDPPWPYGVGAAHPKLHGYSTDKEYKSLDLDTLSTLPIGQLADYVFLWTTVAFTEAGFNLVREWGFEPVTMLFSVKVKEVNVPPGGRIIFKPSYGVGYWFRGAVEPVIVAKRKKAKSIRTQWIGLLSSNAEHSRKPDNLHKVIEANYPAPFIELFARRIRSGWLCLGNEIGSMKDIKSEVNKYLRTFKG